MWSTLRTMHGADAVPGDVIFMTVGCVSELLLPIKNVLPATPHVEAKAFASLACGAAQAPNPDANPRLVHVTPPSVVVVPAVVLNEGSVLLAVPAVVTICNDKVAGS